MNIWLISIFEQTPIDKVFSTRFISIAEEAVKKGHRVTFFASTFKHNTKNQRFEKTTSVQINDQYELVFVKSSAYQKNISAKRLLSHYRYAKNILPEMNKRGKPDVILMAFPPVSLAYEVSKWAKDKSIPVVMDIIDPWPDLFKNALPSVLKPASDVLLYPLSYKLKKTLSNVTAVTAISEQYLAWAKTYFPQLANMHCYYPAVDLQATQEQIRIYKDKVNRNEKALTVIYAGSLASSYDIPGILDAAKILSSKYDNIYFKIAGAGPQQTLIEEYMSNHSNLAYLGRLSKHELMREYYLSDLGLTQHVKGATQSVTYKLFDLLASGLPVLNSLESEMNDIIVKNKVGLFNEPGNAAQLAENIERFYLDRELLQKLKNNALDVVARLGDTKMVYKNFVEMLERYATASENIVAEA
ncbi:MAG: glycosyltransferase family 4 protein [Cyclobacteriaceae bacterium]|nr:glycosyltransferase family 4 protein [Cyclobacteriaceae bacterium]